MFPEILCSEPVLLLWPNGDYMKPVKGYDFYQVGAFVHPLTELQPGAKLNDVWVMLWQARSWLAHLSQGKIVPVSICQPAINSLYWAIDAILPLDSAKWSTLDFEKELELSPASSVSQAAKEFETVFAAEVRAVNTYFVSRKLAYETKILIESAEQIMPSTTLIELPPEAISDIQQAGRCIAFDIPTAAAFHIVRATETVIRKYYGQVVGNPPKPKMRNWGTYIKNLRIAKADERVIGFLDHIREAYRNPVLHPETMLSSDDAQVFLGVCVSSIILMVDAMKKLPTLPMVLAAPPVAVPAIGGN